MKTVYSAIEIIADFTWPFDDHINIITITDNIDAKKQNDLIQAFSLSRESFAIATKTKLEPPRFITMTTSDVFRGSLSSFELDSTILCFDEENSTNIINILLGHTKNMDALDLMLWNKYVVDSNWDRIIFEITGYDDVLLQELCAHLDDNLDIFNYLMLEEFLVIYSHPEKTT